MTSALHDIRTGRFERTLSALTAAGAAVTAGGDLPVPRRSELRQQDDVVAVVVLPTAIPAGIAGFFSRRAAKTVLPVASAAIVANGVQGTYLHCAASPSDPAVSPDTTWSPARRRSPRCLASLVGAMGLLAALLRREDLPLPGEGSR